MPPLPRLPALTLSAILALCTTNISRAQQAPPARPPATPPATTPATRPGIDSTKTMQFNFVNTPVSVILNEMSTRFGFIIVQPAVPIPGYITIQVPNPVGPDEAVRLINSILVPMGYGTIESFTTPGPGAAGQTHSILRIASLNEVKKAQLPVFAENKSGAIPITDTMVTYVIPLVNLDAVRLRADLGPLLSTDADIAVNAGANSLIVTDTSAKIHRLVEIIEALERRTGESTNTMRVVQLTRSSAPATAQIINDTFNPANTAPPAAPAAQAGGQQGGARAGGGRAGARGGAGN